MDNNTDPILTTKDNYVKYTVKDSVFSDLFKDKKYLLKLYRTLHPEDVTATAQDIRNITIKNVLVDDLYNDLGFQMRDQFIILVEAQSTWTSNILIRALIYLVYSYKEYFERSEQNLYSSKKASLPRPELYVIYTGERGDKSDEIVLSQEYFEGMDSALEVRVKVIYEKDTEDIINQYILFSKIYNKCRTKYGRTRTAITETIRICKDKNILKEYLKSREKEVISIMMFLYDDEAIGRAYISSVKRETAEKVAKETAENTVMCLLGKGKLSVEEIADCVDLPSEEVKRLAREYNNNLGEE